MTSFTHDIAPTQYAEGGGIRLADRRFGRPGRPPLVSFQHFMGTLGVNMAPGGADETHADAWWSAQLEGRRDPAWLLAVYQGSSGAVTLRIPGRPRFAQA